MSPNDRSTSRAPASKPGAKAKDDVGSGPAPRPTKRRWSFRRPREEAPRPGAHDASGSEELEVGIRERELQRLVEVLEAVRRGDFRARFTASSRSPLRAVGDVLNDVIARNEHLSSELARVAKVVGRDGHLHERASVGPATGGWADAVGSANQLIADLVTPTNELARVITAVARGDLSKKVLLEVDGRPARGDFRRIGITVNEMVDQLNSFAAEVTRVAREVGDEGKLGGQAEVKGATGTWKRLTDNVNVLAANLTTQVRNIATVTTAVAEGDLSRKITVEAKGEILELKDTINTMVDTLRSFAAEVTRVAKEVGTEGRLGGQADVHGARGTWRALTDSVNVMASNLTTQVRGITKVVTAVASGDLSRRLVVQARGEVAALAETINAMTDTLRIFAEQVTTVAREVGIEGKLGGQAKVPGAAGTWRDLTDNVNQLAGNLTSQVRAIAEVSTAVAQGDLTRSISVEAQGELAALKDNVNRMIANLKATTHKNEEQDWLKTHLARFSSMTQGHRNVYAVAQLIMSELTPLVGAQHGAFYLLDPSNGEPELRLVAGYGLGGRVDLARSYRLGETLIGQCAVEKRRVLLRDVPDGFLSIATGIGEASPRSVVILPVLFEGETTAVIELASFEPFRDHHLAFLDQLVGIIGVMVNMISASMRTDELLEQLKTSNAELEDQARELNEKAELLELKNTEIELASRSLEDKAEQLQLISKYKSEFLANMSHELRTPLNSLLILSKMLATNPSGNLTPEQVRFAETVHASGDALLSLINEILDLSRVEAGKMLIEPLPSSLEEVVVYLEQTFRHMADQRGLSFEIELAPDLPLELHTDAHRLQQVLKNLLSNAFKFTTEGSVRMRVAPSPSDAGMIRFAVSDTGIGIDPDKHRMIFEAFQQADGTTSRKYGGTGLGLTISREITRLLGGTIEVASTPGRGSTFTLEIPREYDGPEARPSVRDEDEGARASALADDVDLTGTRVLVVDDDLRNILAIESVLVARGIDVVRADNGEAAVEIVQADPTIDLVLMDTMMPNMDGLTATRTIRRIHELRSLPIVSLTAKAMKGDREKALEAGASDYVTKPVAPERLLAVVHEWRDRNPRRQTDS